MVGINEAGVFWPLDELQAKVLGLDFVGWRDALQTETFLT